MKSVSTKRSTWGGRSTGRRSHSAWPGTASLEVSLVWTGHPGRNEARILDGGRVAGITPSLDPQSTMPGNPYRLASQCGAVVPRLDRPGYRLHPRPRRGARPRCEGSAEQGSFFPYLTGEDLNSRRDCSASRWIINFHDWPIDKAMTCRDCFSIIQERVMPIERENKRSACLATFGGSSSAPTTDLYDAISDLDRVLVIARHSRTGTATIRHNRPGY